MFNKVFSFLFILLFTISGFSINKYEVAFKKSDSYKRMNQQVTKNQKKIVNVKPVFKKSTRNSKPYLDFSYSYDYEETLVGQYTEVTFHLPPTDATVSWEFSAPILSGSSDFAALSDSCASGGTNEYHGCSVTIRYTPSAPGVKNTEFLYNVQGYVNGLPDTTHTFTYVVSGSSFKYCNDCQSEAGGSIIKIDQRSVSELIPVVGADFDMVFSSNFNVASNDYYRQVISNTTFNNQAWNPSIYNFYDKGAKRLFLGSGAIASRRYFFEYGPSLYRVVSSDNTEVYYFDIDGYHQQTRSFLTGALKYTFQHDINNRLIQITDCFGKVTTFNRDISGKLTSIVSPFGQITTFTTNINGKFSSITNPNSETYSMTYDSMANLLTFTKPGGQVTTLTYDGGGKLTKDLGHGGNFWELIEATIGQISKSSQMGRTSQYTSSHDAWNGYSRADADADGTTSYYYENQWGGSYSGNTVREITREATNDNRFGWSANRPTLSKLKINGVESVTYYSQLTDADDPLSPFGYTYINKSESTSGRTSTTNFNKANLTFTKTSPLGITNIVILNSNEQPVSIQHASDTAKTLAYDTQGRLTSTAQGAQNQINYNYNSTSGFLESITNGRSETTSYVRDLVGRVTSVILPNAQTIQYTYDANGNVTSVTPPGRPAHAFEFNAMELSSKYLPPSLTGMTPPKDTVYSYNLDKQLTQISYPNGQNVNYNYNPTRGLLDSISTSWGNYNYTYETNTSRISSQSTFYNSKNVFTYRGEQVQSDELIYNPNGFSYGKISFGFDNDHRIISRTIQGTSGQPVETANITLNDDSQPTQYGDMALSYDTTSGRLSTTLIGNVTDARTYDSYGNLASYAASYNSGAIYSYTLTRDNMSRITGISETIQGVTTNYVYSYNLAGRLESVTENGTQTASFSYNPNGNRISTTIDGNTYAATYDNQDRMKTYGSNTYTYSKNGFLTGMQNSLGANTTYSFDPLGNLNIITYPSSTQSKYWYTANNRIYGRYFPANFSRVYFYEDDYRIAATVYTTGVVRATYYYPTKEFSPDYMKVNGINYRLIKNHLGSVRLVIKVDDGTVAQRMDYNVLGRVTADTAPMFQPFGFAGGMYDADSGLVHFGARKYDTFTGRWISKDPILFNGGDTNLYGYVVNDPVNFVDPSGLWSLNVSLYRGAGGGITVGQNPNGAWFFGVQIGAGLGGGMFYNRQGTSSDWKSGQQCSKTPILSGGAFGDVSANIGSFGAGYNASAGGSVNGLNAPIVPYSSSGAYGGLTPSIGVGAGASVGVEINVHY